MDLLLSAVAFIVIFSIIILIHEFGHFYVAKKSGIKVEEFGIGLPPRIWGKSFKKNGTIYSVNAIPFGGFVRLYGEDSFDSKMLKDKKSFASKPLRSRIAVVVAGVFMNFLLAIFLLTLGFSFGMEPLIVNTEDVYKAINEGTIETEPGIFIKEIREDGIADRAGLLPEDQLTEIDGEIITDLSRLEVLLEPGPEIKSVSLRILRDGQPRNIELMVNEQNGGFGLDLYTVTYISGVFIRNVEPGSDSVRAGLRAGDVILKMDDKSVFTIADYKSLLHGREEINYRILRHNSVMNVPVKFIDFKRVIISDIETGKPAEMAGFKAGDVILSIDGNKILNPDQALSITKASINQELDYVVDRNGSRLNLKVKPGEDGLIGVFLSDLYEFDKEQMDLYSGVIITTIRKINDVKYPFPESLSQAWFECGRLAGLTVNLAGDLVKSVVGTFAVPEGVAGPVGIARMTHVFAHEGLLALLRFAALISLSLAVINILPFPALDGGRLLFLLVEGILGKRVPAKFEALVHSIGFIMLIALILFVTYSDILNIFL